MCLQVCEVQTSQSDVREGQHAIKGAAGKVSLLVCPQTFWSVTGSKQIENMWHRSVRRRLRLQECVRLCVGAVQQWLRGSADGGRGRQDEPDRQLSPAEHESGRAAEFVQQRWRRGIGQAHP